MEHRWGERRTVSRQVRLRTRGGVAAEGVVINVSISGAFIRTHLPASLLSYVRVHVQSKQVNRRVSAAVEGQVVRLCAEGFALEWIDFAADTLQTFVAANEIAGRDEDESSRSRRAPMR